MLNNKTLARLARLLAVTCVSVFFINGVAFGNDTVKKKEKFIEKILSGNPIFRDPILNANSFDKAEARYKKTLAQLKKFGIEDFYYEAFTIYYMLGEIYFESHRYKMAREHYLKAKAIARHLRKPVYESQVTVKAMLALAFEKKNDPAIFEKVLDIALPGSHDELIIQAHYGLGDVLRIKKKYAEAKENYNRAWGMSKSFYEQNKRAWHNWYWRLYVARYYDRTGLLLQSQDRMQEALANFKKSRLEIVSLIPMHPGEVDIFIALANTYHNLGNALTAMGRPKAGQTALLSGFAILSHLSTRDPENTHSKRVTDAMRKKLEGMGIAVTKKSVDAAEELLRREGIIP